MDFNDHRVDVVTRTMSPAVEEESVGPVGSLAEMRQVVLPEIPHTALLRALGADFDAHHRMLPYEVHARVPPFHPAADASMLLALAAEMEQRSDDPAQQPRRHLAWQCKLDPSLKKAPPCCFQTLILSMVKKE